MGNRVIHFNIQMDNAERAIQFYKKAFGWDIKQVMTKKESGMMDYWLIMTGEGLGIDGGMSLRPQEKEDRVYRLSFTVGVKDMDKTLKDVKANGGSVTMDKNELSGVGFFATIKDTEGNRLDLMQPANPDSRTNRPKFKK